MNQSKSPLLIVLAAPSGAGKTTLCHRLLKDFPTRLKLSTSTTTRSPRANEKNGIDYHFVTHPRFEELLNQGAFAEHAEVHGQRYGTTKETIESCFRAGVSVLLAIDIQGADSLARAYPDRTLKVFIVPPSLEVLETRLRARGSETDESLQIRLNNARREMAAASDFDYVLVNDDLEETYQTLRNLVAERIG